MLIDHKILCFVVVDTVHVNRPAWLFNEMTDKITARQIRDRLRDSFNKMSEHYPHLTCEVGGATLMVEEYTSEPNEHELRKTVDRVLRELRRLDVKIDTLKVEDVQDPRDLVTFTVHYSLTGTKQ